jgi:hypothetical protein
MRIIEITFTNLKLEMNRKLLRASLNSYYVDEMVIPKYNYEKIYVKYL